MDLTAIGIATGLLFTVAYTLIRAIRQKSFDIGSTSLVFLAGVAIPGGVQLIRAAFLGTPTVLPSLWREYVGVAGIVAIGLSLQYVFQSIRNVWSKRIVPIPAREQLGASPQPTEVDIQYASSISQKDKLS